MALPDVISRLVSEHPARRRVAEGIPHCVEIFGRGLFRPDTHPGIVADWLDDNGEESSAKNLRNLILMWEAFGLL